MLFANRRDGWLYGGTGLWFTGDGGAHWRHLTLAGKVTAMTAAAGTAYAAVAPPAGKGQLFRSPVTRAAWAPVGTITAASPLLAVVGRAAWFANGTLFGSPSATYLWATPDGTHWHRYPFACAKGYGLKAITAATPSHLAFLCTGSGFAGGEGKEVMTSADGGKTAHLVGPAPLYGHPTGFAAPPSRPQVITIANTGSGIFTSANAGKNWTGGLIDTSGEPLNSLAYTSPSAAWVVLGMPAREARTAAHIKPRPHLAAGQLLNIPPAVIRRVAPRAASHRTWADFRLPLYPRRGCRFLLSAGQPNIGCPCRFRLRWPED